MSRLRQAALAATIGCGLVLTSGAGIASAQGAAPLAKTVAVAGTAKGAKQLTGTYTIDRFVARGGKLYSVGTLKGRLAGRKVTRQDVRMPAAVAPAPQAAQLPPIPNACQVLNLVLGPINLNLLGLSVRTNQINLRIDAVPGAGNLLGNLLCGITNLLNPGTTPLGQLAQALNAILALAPARA
jgi:hypothetical protein